MKLIIATCLLTLALAAPPSVPNSTDSKDAKIEKYENENDGLGSYYFRYKQSDGTDHYQRGKLVNGHIEVKGKYSFVGQNGVTYSVSYTADENGYQYDIEEGTGPGTFDPNTIPAMLGR